MLTLQYFCTMQIILTRGGGALLAPWGPGQGMESGEAQGSLVPFWVNASLLWKSVSVRKPSPPAWLSTDYTRRAAQIEGGKETFTQLCLAKAGTLLPLKESSDYTFVRSTLLALICLPFPCLQENPKPRSSTY